VGPEAHPVGVGDANAGRQHIVGHPRELVDGADLDRPVGEHRQAHGLEALG
jgi:hypothetical protein